MYTTILNTSSIDKDYEYLSDSSFFINCAETTRQQIRYSQNKDYSFCEDNDIKDLKNYLNAYYHHKNSETANEKFSAPDLLRIYHDNYDAP